MINSRNKGNNYERKIMNELRPFFPDVKTARNESKTLDDSKVDLAFTGCFNIQCKAVESMSVNQILEVLKSMPNDDNLNVMMYKKNRKKELVMMYKDDFYEILEMLKKDENNL
ncbi:hypothetical protein [Carboxylicivirga sp. RSCT41]|uniref:hypothetical protein n=1 Tax=Carboxylicivirga agarovorans TaxID=3417570 RepID=UPI003D337CF6